MELWKKRSYILYLFLGLIMVAEFFVLFYHSGILEGLDKRADKLQQFAQIQRDDATILPGDFYDRNGKLLVETTIETGTSYCDGKAYSQLIGYSGNHRLDLSAAFTENIVQGRDDYRLMAFLDDEYWGRNGLYRTVNADGTKGQSAVLTIDHELQLNVYQALSRQMSESNARGSAVVMDAKTGEILAMVAFPTYNFNQLAEAKVNMQRDEENTDLEPGFPISYKASVAPGSIFKVVLAAALLEHDMEDFTVEDKPFTVNGWKCNNAYSSMGDEITYDKALERSSNVFYAQAALALGKERLQETADKFMLVQNESLLLDFGRVEYHWDLEGAEDTLAQTGFGQGKAELSTVYAAMITQAIANDGMMMKPYVIRELVDARGKSVYTGKPEVLSKAVGKDSADKITKAMLASVKYNCTHHKELRTVSEIFSRFQIAGKTGTAETGGKKNLHNAWFISFAPADDPQYVVAVNQCKTNKGGYRMMTTAAEIFQYLFEEWK